MKKYRVYDVPKILNAFTTQYCYFLTDLKLMTETEKRVANQSLEILSTSRIKDLN